jgi:hypothetical protein
LCGQLYYYYYYYYHSEERKAEEKILKYGMLGLYIFLYYYRKKIFFEDKYKLSLPTSYPNPKYENIETLIASMSVIISINYVYSS